MQGQALALAFQTAGSTPNEQNTAVLALVISILAR